MAHITDVFKRLTIFAALLSWAAFATGCGVDQSPVASSDEALILAPAAKPGGGKAKGNDGGETTSTTASSTETATSSDGTGRPLITKTVSGSFSPDQSDALDVKFSNSYGDWSDLRLSKARFEIQAGALDAAQEITMSVTTGYVLEDLDVDFTPDGLIFIPPGTLTLTIWWGCESCRSEEQLAILDALAQHIHPDATVTESVFEISRQGNAYLTVAIDVPGFSRYRIARY